MSKNKSKGREGVVFSTNPEYEYIYVEQETIDTLPPEKQKLKIMLDKKSRAGKQVTLVTGFTGMTGDLILLSKLIKTKCGVGGTVKDREIIIQGDFRIKINEMLVALGYSCKLI